MEPAGEVRGVRFVNDSKATNVEAARRSIESFPRGVVAIVGGRFKGGDLAQLREPMSASGKAVIAIGEADAPCSPGAGRGGAGHRCRRRCARPSSAGMTRQATVESCSWRRRVRASIGFGTMPSAGTRSRRRSARLKAKDGVSSEQSSVGSARRGASRWERRLPRSARSVSPSTGRLMTADRLRRRTSQVRLAGSRS